MSSKQPTPKRPSTGKPKSGEVKPEEYSGIPIPLYVPNVLGYIRFILIVASWPFALNEPGTFLALYGTSYFLGAIDGPIAKLLGQESFYGTQLDILMSRFATSTLLFAVLKLGLLAIKEEWERMSFAFFFASLFLSDFVSYWFQVYSSYLLDEESHHTSIKPLQWILYTLKLPLVSLLMTLLCECFVVDHYLAFFSGHPLFIIVTSHALYPTLVTLSVVGAVVKHSHNVAHLFVSAVRIVKLDVNQKNEAIKKAK